MLLTLGLDSMFGTLEGALTSINDMMMFPGLRKELVCGIYYLLNALYRGSYVSAHVLLNLLNELGKRDKMRGFRAFYLFFATSLINSIIQEHEYHMTNTLKSHFCIKPL